MYEMIIIAYLFHGSINGGAAVNVSTVPFETEYLCEVARTYVDEEGSFLKAAGFGSQIGKYVTKAHCVKVRENG